MSWIEFLTDIQYLKQKSEAEAFEASLRK